MYISNKWSQQHLIIVYLRANITRILFECDMWLINYAGVNIQQPQLKVTFSELFIALYTHRSNKRTMNPPKTLTTKVKGPFTTKWFRANARSSLPGFSWKGSITVKWRIQTSTIYTFWFELNWMPFPLNHAKKTYFLSNKPKI